MLLQEEAAEEIADVRREEPEASHMQIQEALFKGLDDFSVQEVVRTNNDPRNPRYNVPVIEKACTPFKEPGPYSHADQPPDKMLDDYLSSCRVPPDASAAAAAAADDVYINDDAFDVAASAIMVGKPGRRRRRRLSWT